MKIRTLNIMKSDIQFLSRNYDKGISRSNEIWSAIDWYLQQFDPTVKDATQIITVNLTVDQSRRLEQVVKTGQAINVSELMRRIITEYREFVEEYQLDSTIDPLKHPNTIVSETISIEGKPISVLSKKMKDHKELAEKTREHCQQLKEERDKHILLRTAQIHAINTRIFQLCESGLRYKSDIHQILLRENTNKQFGRISDGVIRIQMQIWAEMDWKRRAEQRRKEKEAQLVTNQ